MNDITLNRDEGRSVPLGRPLAGDPGSDEHQAPLVMRYLRVAARWRWLIIGAIAIALLIGVVITFLATPLYTATTRLEINRESARVVNVAGVEPETSSFDTEFYQTQYGILASRSLAERVVRELRLAENPQFFEMFKAQDAADALARPGSAANPVGRDQLFRAAVDILLRQLEVSPIRLSRLVDISWTSPDPALSARVVNAWSTSFIEYNLQRRYEQTSYARRFLEQRLEQLRGRLAESERQLVGYAANQSIINIPVATNAETGATQERSLVADSLAALNAQLAEAMADRVRAESRVRSSGGSTTEALANPALSSLRQRRAEAAAEYSRLLSQFEPAYPPAQALQAQIEQLDRSIAREESRVQSSIQNTYRDSVQREQTLSRTVEGLKQDFLDQRRRSIQYNIFQRDVDTNRELYNGLLQRYKEIGIAGGVGTNNVAIVDQARVPERPSYPRPLINLLIAIVAGVMVGFSLALIREQIDETIADPSDLERSLRVPLLGAIPKTKASDPHVELHDPKSNLVEAYLSVQTSLAFSTDHGIPRTLAVTSTRPGEGKSTTAYAIAYSIARSGSKTILVDCDMRSPSVHGDLGLPNEKGLSNYLAGTEELSQLIQRIDREPFAVLTAGPQPPNAAELLRGDRLPALLEELKARFDHIVIDSPPIMGLADGPLIASRTEGTIFVVEAGAVKARMARLALGRLRQGRAQVLGAVVTKFEPKRAHFGYGYDYGYGYSYGDEKKV